MEHRISRQLQLPWNCSRVTLETGWTGLSSIKPALPRDLHTDPQNLGLHAPGRERLVPFVRSELNSQFASRRKRINRVSMHFGFETPVPRGASSDRVTNRWVEAKTLLFLEGAPGPATNRR